MKGDLSAKPPVAILFANLKSNIGDFAILHAMLLDVRRRFPGQAVHVFAHGHYEIDRKRLDAFRAACDADFELAGTTYFQKVRPKLVGTLVRGVRLWPYAQEFLISSLADRVAAHASRFGGYAAVFLAGGDHWGGTESGISMFGTLRAVHSHNDQIFAFPFSVNHRLYKFNTNRSLRSNFANIKPPLVVRDSISKKVLDDLEINAILGADCVFSLEDLASRVPPAQSRQPARVLLAVTAGRGKLEQSLRAALRRIGAATGDVALMTTCETEDGKRYETLAREFQIPFHAPVTWQEAVAEIKASSLLVTNRLHGLILGALANTPLLPVADRKKAEAFARDAQVPHSVPGMHALTRGVLDECLADRDANLTKVKVYRDHARQAARSPILEHRGRCDRGAGLN